MNQVVEQDELQSDEIPFSTKIPFSTRGVLPFYVSLTKRYRAPLLGVGFFLFLFSICSFLRIAAVGLLLDAMSMHRGDSSSGTSIEKFEAIWKAVFPVSMEPPTSDLVTDEGFWGFLTVLVIGLGLVSLVLGLAFYLKESISIKIVTGMVVDTRRALFAHLTRQSASYFNDRRAGDLISRVTNDVETVQLSLSNLFRTLLQQPVLVVVGLIFALTTSPFLFLITLPFLLILLVPIFRAGKKVIRHSRRRQQNLGSITDALQQLFSGIRIVKAFGMEPREREEFDKKNESFGRYFRKTVQAKITGRTMQEIMYNLGFIGLLLFGGYMISSGKLSAGLFATFILAMTQIYAPLKAASKSYNQINEASAGLERVLELMRQEPTLKDRPDATKFPGLQQSIRYEGVHFSYRQVPGIELPENATVQPAIIDLNFEVKKGQVVAIVGSSGSGKSTLVDLLARFYDVQGGGILVDGEDIRNFRHASFLDSIAIVSQDPFLFNSSIRENIGYGKVGASEEEIVEAAKAASAHEFILAQPEGYDTVIGERGAKLSGGQRQRLTIARALLKNAPILILDEATSALDSESEREVQRAIDRLIEERTTFVIAHRLSTIVNADNIIVLSEGRIAEQGTHDELMRLGGRYHDLYATQNPGRDQRVEAT